ITHNHSTTGTITIIGLSSWSMVSGDTPYSVPITPTLTLLEPASGPACQRHMFRVAVVAVLAAAPALAWADDDDAEVPQSVQAALVGTNARMQATFGFSIDGPVVALNAHSFAIPQHAAVTSGTAIVDGVRHRLHLENAETASHAFDAMTMRPASDDDRAWAFVLDGTAGSVTVDVLAAHSANIVLELTLDVPTCFYRDARY